MNSKPEPPLLHPWFAVFTTSRRAIAANLLWGRSAAPERLNHLRILAFSQERRWRHSMDTCACGVWEILRALLELSGRFDLCSVAGVNTGFVALWTF